MILNFPVSYAFFWGSAHELRFVHLDLFLRVFLLVLRFSFLALGKKSTPSLFQIWLWYCARRLCMDHKAATIVHL